MVSFTRPDFWIMFGLGFVFGQILWHLLLRGAILSAWCYLWLRLKSRRVVNGDMTGGSIVGRNNMGTMTINGRTFTGSNIYMNNGRILVDGLDVTDETGVDMKSILEIKVTGDVENVTSDKSINVVGNVKGDIDAEGSVNCNAVGGSIRAGGSVSCDDVNGNVEAGGSVNCDDVGGSVKAGGSVNHG